MSAMDGQDPWEMALKMWGIGVRYCPPPLGRHVHHLEGPPASGLVWFPAFGVTNDECVVMMPAHELND